MKSSNHYFYKDHPQTCRPDDYWGQVKRTINGKPISQEQIDLIVDAVWKGLDLCSDDVLLDLCCGNGALTTYLFSKCQGGKGVDFSEYLIKVARESFVRRQSELFQLQDILDFVRTEANPERYTKAVCYGSLQYLAKPDAEEMVTFLRSRFAGLEKVFIGNVPDKSRLHQFFKEGGYTPGIEDSPGSPVGIWRTEEEFSVMASRSGWKAKFSRMPSTYYAAHYRYDVVLTPSELSGNR